MAPVMAMLPMGMMVMATLRTKVGRLVYPDGCPFRLRRIIGVCCGASEQSGRADDNRESYISHFTSPLNDLWNHNLKEATTFRCRRLNQR